MQWMENFLKKTSLSIIESNHCSLLLFLQGPSTSNKQLIHSNVTLDTVRSNYCFLMSTLGTVTLLDSTTTLCSYALGSQPPLLM